MSTLPRRVRRCRHLLFEPRETRQIDASAALRGELRVRAILEWVAWAPHLPASIALDATVVEVLAGLPVEDWVSLTELQTTLSTDALDALLARGLLLGDHPAHEALRLADERFRAAHWWTPAAIAYAGGCWRDVDSTACGPGPGNAVAVAALGPAPAAVSERGTCARAVDLPSPPRSALDSLLDARRTCRNFDPLASLALSDLSQVLHRAFAAHGQVELAPGALALKKTSPSGGGLHPVEAFVLVQRVPGVAPGIYQHHAIDHRLLPVLLPEPSTLRALARDFVAGQDWFADAAVLVVMVARFERNQWKYRNHPKALRVTLLDAGHLGQTLALAATECGMGVFITGAINEHRIAESLDLHTGREGAVAICGFGPRAPHLVHPELTPDGLLGD